jgi:predicted O-linked N-acetylglucosamine transferase (SPINDLY family)
VLNNLNAALQQYQTALVLQPDHVELLNNLGNVLKDLGRLDEAIAHYERALQLDPTYFKAHNNLGNAFKELGLLDQAVACYQNTLQLDPQQLDTLSNLLFVMSYHPQCTPAQYLAHAVHYGNMASASARPFSAWAAPGKRLRVGLVSGDLRNHPIGYFLESILLHINTEQIELIAYSTKPHEDELTARIKPYFTNWRLLSGLSNEAAAHQIHQDGIQILVDLSGHTAHNRLPIFAWKPAPVQVSWLGYFASTGLPQMDYLLADPVSVPENHRQHFSETICYLPDTRLCFTAPEAPPVSPLPALKNGYVTLGCFQNLSKIGDHVLAAWASIMRALPSARLRLQNPQLASPAVAGHVQQRLLAHGIGTDRLILVGPGTRNDYFAAHAEVDMILDTFPYPGGTTTCEALWMGVPTLTLAGETLLARQGASLLSSAGLDDWVVTTTEEYIARGVAFASNLSTLAALRSTLREQIKHSPLFDAATFSKNLELAFRDMWAQKSSTVND